MAIKVLHANLAGDPLQRERFFRGARRMAELDHPAIVRVLDPHGEDGGFHFFVMELVSGGDLRQAELDKRLSNDRIISVILRLADAVAFAHAKGIVHRDIKPAPNAPAEAFTGNVRPEAGASQRSSAAPRAAEPAASGEIASDRMSGWHGGGRRIFYVVVGGRLMLP